MRQFDQFAADGFQEFARLGTDTLRIREMAWILVCDLLSDLLLRRSQPKPGQVFGYILDLRFEFFRPAGEFRIVFEKVVVLLHVRPAAGGVGDDCIVRAFEKDLDVTPRQRP